MPTLAADRKILRKPSWAKKNLVPQELTSQAEEAVKNGYSQKFVVFNSNEHQWAIDHVAPQFLEYCERLDSPEILSFFTAAKSLRTSVNVVAFTSLYSGGTDLMVLSKKLDKLSLSIDFPSQDMAIVYCPWNGAWAAEGLGGLSLPIDEIKDRFMAGNYDFKPSSWGRDVRKAIEDYAFLKSESSLRLDKNGDLIAATSGGRIIFRSSSEALAFLYPEGYNPRESENLSLVIDDRLKDLIAKVRECPGAGSWNPN